MSQTKKTTISVYKRDAADWGKMCTLLGMKSPDMFKIALKISLMNSNIKHHLEHGDMDNSTCLLTGCPIHYPMEGEQ